VTEGETPSQLTRREREVAELVAEGLTNREIADRLVVSSRTAEYHVEQIRNKLGFGSRREVATWVKATRAGHERKAVHPSAAAPQRPPTRYARRNTRAGVHVGECEAGDGAFSGFTVSLAEQIADQADSGEVLVSALSAT
jgi:DNA-binding CsgD family transcriptional regulator